jgi:hypothetical protein
MLRRVSDAAGKAMAKYESTDRKPAEYLLFALAFAGFLFGGAGIILTSLSLAMFGLILMLGSISVFLALP